MTSNQGGFEVSLGRAEPERIEARRERLRRQAQVHELPVRDRAHWANRRFAATLDIRDSDHVETLRPVQASLKREKFYRRGLGIADSAAATITIAPTALAWGRPFDWLFLLVPLAAVLISKIQGLYDRDDMVLRKSSIHEWRAVFRTHALITRATYLVWWVSTTARTDHGIRVFAFMLGNLFVLTLAARTTAPAVRRAVFGKTLAAHRRVEVLEHVKAFHEVRLDRALDDLALKVAMAAHAGQLTDLLEQPHRRANCG